MKTTHPVRQWLEDHELSQQRLAEQTGLDPSALSRFMRGERSLSIEAAKRIKEVTGLSLDAIYSDAGRAA